MIDINKLNLADFIKIDETLNNFTFHTNVISVQSFYNKDDKHVDLNKKQEILYDNIRSSINDVIRTEVLKKLYDEKYSSYDIFDITDSIYFNQMRKFNDLISNENRPALVTNARIAGENIMDSQYFHSTGRSKDIIYKIGLISNTIVHVDPYLRFNDYKAFLIKEKIGINIIDLNISEEYMEYGSYNLNYKVTFKLAYNLDDIKETKVIYVIDNDNQDALPIIKARKRDEKLNDLLNG